VLLAVYPSGSDWIAWTPEGYYAATPGGEKLIGWHVNNGVRDLATVYPADRFRKRFYKPEVIKLLLEKGSVKKALEAAREKPAQIEQILPPGVELKMDRAGPKVRIHATATPGSASQPVLALRLLLDGRPCPGVAAKEFETGEPFVADWEVESPPGRHELKVLARCHDVVQDGSGGPAREGQAASTSSLRRSQRLRSKRADPGIGQAGRRGRLRGAGETLYRQGQPVPRRGGQQAAGGQGRHARCRP
jgi:hypothetical protein